MKKTIGLFAVIAGSILMSSCAKVNSGTPDQPVNIIDPVISGKANAAAAQAVAVTENFESGTKGSYTTGNVTLTTGSWSFNDALLGNLSTDKKNGTQSARVRNSGILSTNFDFTTGASVVTVYHAVFGTDGSSTWQLWYSTNGGSSYVQSGSTVTTSSSSLVQANFTINVSGNIRFQVRKTDGSANRINFDDFTVNPANTVSVPTLTSISPSSAVAGSQAFTITATGSNFINGSTINWNGAALSTGFVSATQLTATVPAANVATAGTASVTVTTAGAGTSGALTFTINAQTSGAKKFLFDATKAETAGNADWVIDEDNSTPQRIPTPTQSTVTASTPETYWTGAISSWGIALAKQGYKVETLPSTGAITYGNSSNAQDLSNYDVFVVDEPNTRFTTAEKQAILNFVSHGGGLFMVSDHTVSDRDNDGWDSPDIWNDLMTNNGLVTNPFGFSVDLTNISQVSTNVLTGNASNVILHGSQGNVTQLSFNNGATLTLNSSVNPTVQGLVWQNTFAQSSTHVMSASSTYGSGRVFAVTDSSPIDDGTGASGNNLFVGWSLYSHTQLFMNASLWLAKLQ